MKKLSCAVLTVLLLPITLCATGKTQMDIAHMHGWPNTPTPFYIRDWQATSQAYYRCVLNPAADAPRFPVTTLLPGTFGMVTYLGGKNATDHVGEAVTQLATVLGASLTEGIDPRSLYGVDWVEKALVYFGHTPDGRGFASNNAPRDDCTDSFWYTLYPTVLFFQLAAQYPEDERYDTAVREVADTWIDALAVIGGDFMHMGFSVKGMRLTDGSHIEPEGVYGIAYVEFMAYVRYSERKYLDAALACMRLAQRLPQNPYYEILGSYAPALSARMQAETGEPLAVERFLNWVFTDGHDAARNGWGIMNGNWNSHDAYGLSGSLTDSHGYAFAMNTFITAGAIAPMARYAPQYSRDIGKYLLAVANNANMFFGDGLPKVQQSDGEYARQTGLGYLVYEGVRCQTERNSPYATGDAKAPGNLDSTNFSFYSGGPVGLFSSMITPTNVPQILCIDLLKTDFGHAAVYPTYLYYNPTDAEQEVLIDVGAQACDLYDAVPQAYLAKGVSGEAAFVIAPGMAAQLVLLPAGSTLVRGNGRILCGDTVVAYEPLQVYSSVSEGMHVQGSMDFAIGALLPAGERVARFTLTCGTHTLYDGVQMPDTFTLDTTALKNGWHILCLRMETVAGRSAEADYGIRVLNLSGAAVHTADASALAEAFRAAGGHAEATGAYARLTTDDALVLAALPQVRIDFAKKPIALLRVDCLRGAWGLKCVIDGAEYYLQGDTCYSGDTLIDLTVLPVFGQKEITLLPFITGNKGEINWEYVDIWYTQS